MLFSEKINIITQRALNKMSFQNVKSDVYDGSKKGGRASGRVANKVSKKVNAAKEQKLYEKNLTH